MSVLCDVSIQVFPDKTGSLRVDRKTEEPEPVLVAAAMLLHAAQDMTGLSRDKVLLAATTYMDERMRLTTSGQSGQR